MINVMATTNIEVNSKSETVTGLDVMTRVQNETQDEKTTRKASC